MQFHVEYTKNYDRINKRTDSWQLHSILDCRTTDYKTLEYRYDTEGQVSGFSYGSYDVEYTYDKIGRLTDRIASVAYMSYEEAVNENYVYKTYGNGYTTNLLTRIDDQTAENNDRTATYDANGYVTSVSYNGSTYTYTYDGLGRLTSEAVDGSTTTYTYDNANNIQKTGLTYTNGKLTAVNGAQIVYDAMGNPTTYKGNAFVWEQGRKLASGTMNGKQFSYSYDGNGMRYEKVVSGVKTQYYYNDTQLLMESKNGKRKWYIYGVTGIEGMIVEGTYQDSVYYFDKNTLGDVIAIRDEYGDVVARYTYDAWGNIIDQDGEMAEMNPFRYRGYYYDTETGFYYLQTRYYDPTICRFINADNYELVSELASSMQLNMYAYCGNNPIMYTDETGEIVISLLVGLGISFVIGFGTSIVSQGMQYGWNNINYLQAGVDGLFAATSTGVAYTGIGIVASMAIGATMGLGQYTIDSTLFRNDFTWQGALIATGLGALAGAVSGAGAKNLKKIANKLEGRASQGVKALITTTQRYGINSAQVGLVRNLYQASINTATQAIIGKAFTQAVFAINGMTIANAIGMYYLA